MPALADTELYGVLGDTEETYRQLREQRNSALLSRYPSFHASPLPNTSTPGASSSSAPKSPRPSQETGFHVKRAHKPRSDEGHRSDPDPQEDHYQEPEDSANRSWYDQEAEVWKPKNTAGKLTRRQSPPSRPQPGPPVSSSPSHPPPTSFPAGLTIVEPAQKFARVKGPTKSAMKTPKPIVPHEPAPLPSTAYLSPETAGQRRFMLRQQPAMVMSPPSTVIGSQGWQSPATTHGRLSSAASAANSHSRRGSSTGTSSVAFTTTSSSLYSAPSQVSAPPSAPPVHYLKKSHVPNDGEPDENPAPRQTLFVVNADPDTSESEHSPVVGMRPQFPPQPPRGQVSRRKAKDNGHGVPPVPPLPVQFKAPPPPNYPPPPGDRSRSDPTVPGVSQSNSDRNRTKLGRHSSDNRTGANHTGSKPIPIPPTSKHSSNGVLHRSGSGSSASSRSNTPYTPPEHDAGPIAGVDIPPEWIYPLPLTLEELFKGGKYTYRITTRLLSGAPKIQEVEVDVKPGWKSGTRIIFPSAGNERTPGKFQDMIFVVEQVHHERFARLDGGRLVLNQDIDLVDALKENVQREARKVVGIDGNIIQFYPPQGVIRSGKETVVKGQGMWIRSKSQVIGRGDLIIRWNVVMPNHPLSPDQVTRMREIFN